MDCLEFRRQLGADPRTLDRAARAHLDGCAGCTEAHSRALAFEARLANAMAVPVPDGLADRILLAQLTGDRQRQRNVRRRVTWVALAAAASLVLGVGLLRQSGSSLPSAALPDLVAAHVIAPDERDALQKTAALPTDDIRHAFSDRGVTLASVPADVAYVSECGIGKFRTVHMVMPESGAPVSVVYVVEHRAKATQDFQRSGLAGREVPMANGTLVMLAPDSGRFDALEHSWRLAIEGSPNISAGAF
ncbi:MAG: DUF3379 family protein [Dokdonella sp.]|uniref:DUF3379 family protein n=1 Tax=Dokdonella sp. TaxID=2291710 RepID=UPI003263125C